MGIGRLGSILGIGGGGGRGAPLYGMAPTLVAVRVPLLPPSASYFCWCGSGSSPPGTSYSHPAWAHGRGLDYAVLGASRVLRVVFVSRVVVPVVHGVKELILRRYWQVGYPLYRVDKWTPPLYQRHYSGGRHPRPWLRGRWVLYSVLHEYGAQVDLTVGLQVLLQVVAHLHLEL
jgi:hypothetical protein